MYYFFREYMMEISYLFAIKKFSFTLNGYICVCGIVNAGAMEARRGC